MDNGAEKNVAGLPAFTHYCATLTSTWTWSQAMRASAWAMSYTTAWQGQDKDADRGNFIEYTTDVVNVDIPILLGLDMMTRLKWYVNESSV